MLDRSYCTHHFLYCCSRLCLIRGTSSSKELAAKGTSDLSGLFANLLLVLALGIGSDFLEHGSVFEDVRDDNEADLAAAQIDLFELHGPAIARVHLDIIEANIHGVLHGVRKYLSLGHVAREHFSSLELDSDDVVDGFV